MPVITERYILAVNMAVLVIQSLLIITIATDVKQVPVIAVVVTITPLIVADVKKNTTVGYRVHVLLLLTLDILPIKKLPYVDAWMGHLTDGGQGIIGFVLDIPRSIALDIPHSIVLDIRAIVILKHVTKYLGPIITGVQEYMKLVIKL